MRKELAAVKQDNYAKTGEVAIVRSQLERQAKERERERAAIQKAGEERLAKQRKELEAAQIAARTAVTERDFIKQDLMEVQRAQNLNKVAEKRDIGTTTPKKKKALPHRDGFDDDEVELLSPSKLSPSKFQKRIGTPTKAGKRKRKAMDSPIAPLEVIQTEELSAKPEDEGPAFDQAIAAKPDIEDDRLEVSLSTTPQNELTCEVPWDDARSSPIPGPPSHDRGAWKACSAINAKRIFRIDYSWSDPCTGPWQAFE